MELYKKYRPQSFSEVLGQPETVKMLEKMVKENDVPHSILFSGPSGSGKTTLCRILAKELNCSGTDLVEVNIADFRGIDTVREIRKRLSLVPLGGKNKVWILDETQTLRADAQHSLLKILEDGSSHVYFFLATTEPQKLLSTIRNRCTEIKTKLLDVSTMEQLLDSICSKEGKTISQTVREKIVEVSEGSARKALVLLHQVLGLTKEKEQMQVILTAEEATPAIKLARYLLSPSPNWRRAAALIKQIEEEPEQVRRMILGYVNQTALNGGLPKRCMHIIDHFSSPYYDCGKAGLSWSVWHCCVDANKRRK